MQWKLPLGGEVHQPRAGCVAICLRAERGDGGERVSAPRMPRRFLWVVQYFVGAGFYVIPTYSPSDYSVDNTVASTPAVFLRNWANLWTAITEVRAEEGGNKRHPGRLRGLCTPWQGSPFPPPRSAPSAGCEPRQLLTSVVSGGESRSSAAICWLWDRACSTKLLKGRACSLRHHTSLEGGTCRPLAYMEGLSWHSRWQGKSLGHAASCDRRACAA